MDDFLEPMTEPISVLIVEDKAEFLTEFLDKLAAVSDMRVVATAGTVAEALACLSEVTPDVLLVDLGLPDGSGLEVIRAVAQRWPGDCDVMVVSVFADEAHVLAAIEAGATGYLLKDSSRERFVEQIRELRAGGSPISPIIARKLLSRFAEPAPTVNPVAHQVNLTAQERAVLAYAARGYSYDEVAQLMGITRHTVMSYVKRSYRKLHVHSKTEAIYEARRMGLVTD